MTSGEFGFIEQLAKFAKKAPESLSLQDDGAIISCDNKSLIVVKDLAQAGVHALADDNLVDLVRKAIRVNLSDLAAMGANPRFILLGLSIGPDQDIGQLSLVSEEIRSECIEFNIHLIGGDTVQGLGPNLVSVTAIGELAVNPILRSGAKIGDDVWVSGTIGDGALGLRMLQAGRQDQEFANLSKSQKSWLAARYRWPSPRIELGLALVGLANAAIDISDGLVADAGHIAKNSGVELQLEIENIPQSEAFAHWANAVANSGQEWAVLAGGDDYELLFTAPFSLRNNIQQLTSKIDCEITRIGKVQAGNQVVMTTAGKAAQVPQAGFTHF